MSQVIKITIIKSLAVDSAKNLTYLKGNIDKAAARQEASPATTVAFHEQAGDEQYHERLLARSFFTSVERLKTWLGDYLTDNGFITDDPLVSNDEASGNINILLTVSDRYNRGYTKTLARLSQEFVENRMVHLWYAPIDENKAAFYARLAEDDLTGIRASFTKTAPTPPQYPYPTAINIRYPIIPERNGEPGIITGPVTMPDGYPSGAIPVERLYANPLVITKGEETEVSYTLSGENNQKPIDDIIVRCDNTCCQPALTNSGRWSLRAIKRGYVIVTLFSRHNDQVAAAFALRIV